MNILQCIFIIASLATLIHCEDCLVQTRLGNLRGKTSDSRSGKKFCSFLGIPFANKPKRFEEAELKDRWDGVLNAYKAGPPCPQVSGNAVVGDENCLSLNVFYPTGDQCSSQGKPNRELPVMVHIHGGSYVSGSGDLYGPNYYMDECVVYISINYRLGALGFLTTKDDLIPGNLGLKDQRLALKWIQMNIEKFGGNKNLVTINGISAGSCSVSHLVASLSAAGLFQRAIAQSGSALNPWGIIKNPDSAAKQLGQVLNCAGGAKEITTADLKKCLLTKKFEDIVVNQHKLGQLSLVPFGPVVEAKAAKNAFHKQNPYNNLKMGLFNKVPMIQGFTEDEGLTIQALPTILNKQAVKMLNDYWSTVAPMHLLYNESHIPDEKKKEFSEKIYQFYFGNKSISEETLQNLTNLHSDRYFVQGLFENVKVQSYWTPVYPYVFTFKGQLSFAQLYGYKKPVATHGDDGLYFFNIPGVPTLKQDTQDGKISVKLIKLWMSFAQNGKPSETWPTANSWQPYNTNRDVWYQLDTNTQNIPNYLGERRAFWNNLGLNIYDYPSN